MPDLLTRVLTPSGWQPCTALTDGLVAVYHRGVLSYQSTSVERVPFEGELLALDHPWLSLCLPPNQFCYAKEEPGTWKFTRVSELEPYSRLINTFKWEGSEEVPEYVDVGGYKVLLEDYFTWVTCFDISFTNCTLEAIASKRVVDVSLPFLRRKHRIWFTRDREVVSFLKQDLRYTEEEGVRIPRWILNLPVSTLEALVKMNFRSFRVRVHSKAGADDFLELFLKCGLAACQTIEGGYYLVRGSQRQEDIQPLVTPKHFDCIPYRGEVFSLEEGRLYLYEREGRVCIAG